MLERDESALHSVQLSLDGRGLLDDPNLVVADIRDVQRVEDVFDHDQPQVVFHTAALKHVPLLEMHPEEGQKTNVVGTRNLLEASLRIGVERFVNISTDKAADPINVLGRTKRIAEQLTACAADAAAGDFMSVRFGNVLGSRGSVLTAFRQQIEDGGPVTVTHPDVTRYFMTIPEAVELVIQAGAIGASGDAFVLDMGEPVRISEVARRLVEQAERPIEIIFTGLRPGEKLHEVLLGEDEQATRPRTRSSRGSRCPHGPSQTSEAAEYPAPRMAGSEDPRLDRVIAALNTLEATQRSQAGAIDRLHAELASALRDAAEAREDAAFAKAETAAYQAEMASTVRRNELERLAERLDATDEALVDVHRRDSQAASVRDQVVKLSRALSKAVSVSDLTEVSQRMEQIDDRLQVRLDHLSADVVATASGSADLRESVAQLSAETGEVGQQLDQRARSLEAGRDELIERFERVVATAEAEIDRVAGHLDVRITDVLDRLVTHEAKFAGLTDPEPAIDQLTAESADLNRSVRVLRSTVESDRTVVRDLDQRVFGPEGLAARLMQLAQVVVEQNEREPIPTPTDPALLAFQGRIEDLVTRVEALSSLRTRVEVLEKRSGR